MLPQAGGLSTRAQTRHSSASLLRPQAPARLSGIRVRRRCRPPQQCRAALPELLTETAVSARDFSAFLLGASVGAGAAVMAAQLVGSGSPAPERLVSRLRLKQASKLLSVGPPDKVVTGVGCEVVQHLLDYTWPGIGNVIAIALRRRLAMVIENLDSQTINNIDVEDLSLGEAAPTVLAVKLYSTDPDKVILDAEVNWETFDSQLRLKVQLKETLGTQLLVPVEVTNLRYQGVLRIVMTPLLDRPPFFGSLAFTTCSEPDLSFSLKVLGGEVSAIPGLRQALRDAGVAALKRTFVWPRRVLLPLKRAKSLEFLDTVLAPDEIERLRSAEYDDLDTTRVRSWGNPARTRRVARLVEGRRNDRKRPLSRAWSATRSVAAASWDGARSRVKRWRGALGKFLGTAEAAAAEDAASTSERSGGESGPTTFATVRAPLGASAGGDGKADADGASPKPRRRWLSRVWRMLRRVRRSRAKQRLRRGAAAAASASAAAGSMVLSADVAGFQEDSGSGLHGSISESEDDDDDDDYEWVENDEEADRRIKAAAAEEELALAAGAGDVFSLRGTLIRGVQNAGKGDV